MALSLGAEGIEYLEPGHFQTFLSYRWLTSSDGYIGTDKWDHHLKGDPQPGDYATQIGARIKVHSLDWNLTYALSKRFSLSATLPFVEGTVKSKFEHLEGAPHAHHKTHASGIGDFRLTANAWLWDPDVAQKGNVSLSLGVKTSTGDDQVTDTFYQPRNPGACRVGQDGKARCPVDIAIQPGDGGWGLVLEMQAFRNLLERTYFYATAFYLANPRETNTANAQNQRADLIGLDNSIPDQYQGRLGLSYLLWPHQGLAFSLGARIDGINQRDLIGRSDGFRRPGYSIYVEPGLILSRGKTTFSLYVPVLAAANRQLSVPDKEFFRGDDHPPGPHKYAGAFADYLVLFSVSRRF